MALNIVSYLLLNCSRTHTHTFFITTVNHPIPKMFCCLLKRLTNMYILHTQCPCFPYRHNISHANLFPNPQTIFTYFVLFSSLFIFYCFNSTYFLFMLAVSTAAFSLHIYTRYERKFRSIILLQPSHCPQEIERETKRERTMNDGKISPRAFI